MRRPRGQRGAALMKDTAREGGPVSVLSGATEAQVTATRDYLTAGRVPNAATTPIVGERAVPVGTSARTVTTPRWCATRR